MFIYFFYFHKMYSTIHPGKPYAQVQLVIWNSRGESLALLLEPQLVLHPDPFLSPLPFVFPDALRFRRLLQVLRLQVLAHELEQGRLQRWSDRILHSLSQYHFYMLFDRNWKIKKT